MSSNSIKFSSYFNNVKLTNFSLQQLDECAEVDLLYFIGCALVALSPHVVMWGICKNTGALIVLVMGCTSPSLLVSCTDWKNK